MDTSTYGHISKHISVLLPTPILMPLILNSFSYAIEVFCQQNNEVSTCHFPANTTSKPVPETSVSKVEVFKISEEASTGAWVNIYSTLTFSKCTLTLLSPVVWYIFVHQCVQWCSNLWIESPVV